MYTPIKDYKQKNYPEGNVTQWFGENPNLYNRWGLKGHNGIDIVAPYGEPLLAVEDGTIIDVKDTPEGYGKHVRLLSKATVNEAHREWTYAHCSAIHVSVGDTVKAGNHIADMGNTGFVISGATPWWKHNPYAGTHLHLGVRMARLSDSGWRYTKNSPRVQIQDYENGYRGCYNPASYFQNTTTKRQKMLTLISLLNQVVALLEEAKKKKHA